MDTAIGALHPQTIILSIRPSGRAGRFLGYIGDELIVTNQQPFLDGVRDSAMKMPDIPKFLKRGPDNAPPSWMAGRAARQRRA